MMTFTLECPEGSRFPLGVNYMSAATSLRILLLYLKHFLVAV